MKTLLLTALLAALIPAASALTLTGTITSTWTWDVLALLFLRRF